MNGDAPTPRELMDAILDLKAAMEFGFTGVTARLDGHDRRFDDLEYRLNKRFDIIDQRFDGYDRRFDGIDQRLDGMDQRFEKTDAKIDDLRGEMCDRLDRTEVRVGKIETRRPRKR